MRQLKKCLLSALVMAICLGNISVLHTSAQGNVGMTKISAHSATGYEATKINDGNTTNGWRSMPQNGEGDPHKQMYDHNRYIDIVLDGTYDITSIKVFNEVDGSFNNYYIYASADGDNFNKIVSKTDNSLASAEGNTHNLSSPVRASYLRLNMAYNSNRFETNLAELQIFGTKINDSVATPTPISVTPWNGSTWQQEWDRFETDKKYANEKVLKEMSNLVGRVIGDNWKSSFVFELKNSLQGKKDIFEIKDGANNTIVISGNNGIAMASGFNYYLRNYLNVDYNPMFASNVSVNSIVPVGKTITKEAQFDLRYALNFCTYSYTMAFWNWKEYEAFLDWAAMNGVNLVLDIVGQEEVLRQTLREYNYTDDEIRDYLAGPAYFAWFYMQNLFSSGGPLPKSWFSQRVELGRQMHDRMQTYGISPVIQGFAGQVPHTFAQKNEGAVLTPVDGWVGYTRPSIIKTYLTQEEINSGKVNYFAQVAKTFYEKQKNVFGDVSNYYATDPFHEGGNTGGLDIATIYKQVQDEMLVSNPNAIWVMQQWQGNLNGEKMSQMQTSKALALDLQTDMRQEHDVFEKNGTPWIYCMLHNFGGRMGMDGELPLIAEDPMNVYRNRKNMTGIGITPEALENSPVVYELFFDTLWSKDIIDVHSWLQNYAKRRAGGDSTSLQKAWQVLLETAYANKKEYIQGAAETVVNARPSDSFTSASTWGHSTIEYDKKVFDQALPLLLENYDQFKNSPAYKYDLADVAEQVLSNAAVEYHKQMVQAKNANNAELFETTANKFLALIELSDQILSSSEEFLVGTWINDSRKMITGADDWTKDLFEFNARSLITTWGGQRVGGLKDYSNRKWAGLTNDFYKARWQIWINNRLAELKGLPKNPADVKAEQNWFLWEFQWVNRKSDDGFGYASTAADVDLKALATRAYNEFSVTNFTGVVATAENVLANKLFTTSAATQSGELAHITDGTTATEWVAQGDGEVVLEVDLQGTYDLNQITISLPQLAKTFPYTYKLEAYNENAWTLVKEDTSSALSSNVEINQKVVASKLKLTMRTTDLASEPLRITEIKAFGTALATEKVYNIAKGLMPTTNKTNTDGGFPLTNITDDNDTSFWKTTDWGDGAYPANVGLDLGYTASVDEVEVVFEKPGLPFKFTVMGINGDGSAYVIDDTYANLTDTLTAKAYRFPVNKDIKGIRIDYHGITGKGEAHAAGPALAELRIFSKINPQQTLADINIEGLELSGPALTNGQPILDNDKDSFALVNKNQDLIIDLPHTTNVTELQVTFEKGCLGVNYEVWVENVTRAREKVAFKDSGLFTNESDNERYTAYIPINRNVNRIIFIHQGNNGLEPAYAAEHRIYEIDVIGKPSPAIIEGVNAGDYTVLFDNNSSTSMDVATNAQFEVVLPYAIDLYAISAVKSRDTINMDVEVFVDGNYVPFGTLLSTVTNEAFILDNSILTNKIRFTAKDNMQLQDIKLYVDDKAYMVQKTIDEINGFINAQKYEGLSGHYTLEAKDALLAEVTAVSNEITGQITSIKANELINRLNAALKEFKINGRVYIDRTDLLSKLDHTNSIINALTQVGLETEKIALQAVYDVALGVYNTLDVTQNALNEQISLLDAKVNEILPTLEAKTALIVEVNAAEEFANNASIGDKGSQYPQAAKEALLAVVTNAKTEMEKETADYAAIQNTVKEAVEAFKASIIKINKVDLNIQIATSEQQVSDSAHAYDAVAYKAYIEALEAAKNTNNADDTTISQANVDGAKDALLSATTNVLANVLNYSELSSLVNQNAMIDLSVYTLETREAYQKALNTANAILRQTTVDNTQVKINEAKEQLQQALDGLRVDMSGLQGLVDTTVDTTNKPQGVIDSYNNALTSAKEMLKNTTASYEEYIKVKVALEKAIKELEDAQVLVNKDKLVESILKAQAVDTTKYTEETVKVLNNVLKQAQALYNDINASQDSVDKLTQELLTAIKNLEVKPIVKPTPQPTDKPTVKPTVKPEPTKKPVANGNGGYDDGGPFTTDECGSIYDRWGNLMWKANHCIVNKTDGYNIVNTSDR